MHERDLREVFEAFDAVVDAPLVPAAVAAVGADGTIRDPPGGGRSDAGGPRTGALGVSVSDRGAGRFRARGSWEVLCDLLGLVSPVDEFPVGAPRSFRLFRHDSPNWAARVRSVRGGTVGPWMTRLGSCR